MIDNLLRISSRYIYIVKLHRRWFSSRNRAGNAEKDGYINYSLRMKELQSSLSPIQPKNPRKAVYCEEMADRIDLGHFHQQLSVLDSLDWTHLEQKVTNAAKTIVYLFTPEIDLLYTLEKNLSNYDKYQRTRLILKQLVNSIHENRYELQTQALKTHQQMENLQKQINSLKVTIGQLERERFDSNKAIEDQRQTIIRLTEAYTQAKMCYEAELEELRHRPDHFSINITGSNEQSSKSKSNSKSEREKQMLMVPKHRQRKKSDLFTDRSMYQRFRVCQVNQAKNEPQEHSSSIQNTHLNHYILKVEKLQFQKEALQRKLTIAEQEYQRLASLQIESKQRYQKARQDLEAGTEVYKKELDQLLKKLGEKNRIIEELLAVIEGKA